jgi:hypothetical protein
MPVAIKDAAGCFGHGRFAGWLQVEQFWGSSFEWSTTAFMVEAENGGDG